MKYQALFSSKDKSKKKLVSSAANFYLVLQRLTPSCFSATFTKANNFCDCLLPWTNCSSKRGLLLRKVFASRGSKFFSLGVDPY